MDCSMTSNYFMGLLVVTSMPIVGFIVQESGTSIADSNAEIQTYFGSGSITNSNQQRNFR